MGIEDDSDTLAIPRDIRRASSYHESQESCVYNPPALSDQEDL